VIARPRHIAGCQPEGSTVATPGVYDNFVSSW
jgi:hypothetical protein